MLEIRSQKKGCHRLEVTKVLSAMCVTRATIEITAAFSDPPRYSYLCCLFLSWGVVATSTLLSFCEAPGDQSRFLGRNTVITPKVQAQTSMTPLQWVRK